MKCLVLANWAIADISASKHIEDVVECIVSPALGELNAELFRPMLGQVITDQIPTYVESADFTIAILHGSNACVTFGIASAISVRKRIIILRHMSDGISIQIHQMQELVYDLEPQSIYRKRFVNDLADILRRSVGPAEVALAPRQKGSYTLIGSAEPGRNSVRSGAAKVEIIKPARLLPQPSVDEPGAAFREALSEGIDPLHVVPTLMAGREASGPRPDDTLPNRNSQEKPVVNGSRAGIPSQLYLPNIATHAHTCMMTHGLYLKANLELPCWDDAGEDKILRQLDSQKLASGTEIGISNSGALIHIRESFARGKLPYPGVCERCAVLSHGRPVTEMRPTVLDVLHVEPSYLCHLGCPQCVPPKLRKSLKSPPYHLAPDDYEGFLSQLKRDGVKQIKLVIFEGRGDPLNNKNMGELVNITKKYFPEAFTSITTHGNFPFKPWMIDAGVDLIRFSVDGAFQENYAKYRVGGRLDSALRLMREIIDYRKENYSNTSIEWKYILFEWNDSDEELLEAANIARKLQVELRLCRTHSPGRSKRFPDAQSVRDIIGRLALDATPDLTFQLKTDHEEAGIDVLRDDKIQGCFERAFRHLDAGELAQAQSKVDEALSLDRYIERPVTASYMANYEGRQGKLLVKATLLKRYLSLLPSARDFDYISAEILLYESLDAVQRGDIDVANKKLSQALAFRFGFREGWLERLGDAAASEEPNVVSALANIAREAGDLCASALLFKRYLTLAPKAADRNAVLEALRLMGDTTIELEV